MTNNDSYLLLLLLIPVVFIFVHKSDDPAPEWNFERKAIKIEYSTDTLLNSFNGKPHTLAVVIYQLTDVKPFLENAEASNGVKNLLSSGRFDESVVGVDKLMLQPGEKKTLLIDRAEHARWVGIAAGYYNLDPAGTSMVFKLPYEIVTKGIFRKTKTAVVKHLTIFLDFGPETINKADSI